MAKTHGKKLSSFTFLNFTQFFSALNDNIFKLLLVFNLLAIQGVEKSNTILSLAGTIFVIPFLLFASISGFMADRFSKRKIIFITRLTEIAVVSGGVLSFYLKSVVGGYATLFLMATQSALFSPCKYGIIPEIVKKEKISHYNGIITATTYLAIILGTFFASFLAEVTMRNFTLSSAFCVVIALFGFLCSLGIEKTEPQAKGKRFSFHFITDIFHTLHKARKIRYLLPTILFGAYFLFMGAYMQLNIIPFAIQSLSLSEIEGGYLFLMTAIGIGMGAFLAGKLSKEEVELGIVPITTFAMAILLTLLYLFQHQHFTVIVLLIVLGVLGGFYIVPIESFIQFSSPSRDRGENVAVANFSNFVGVIIASGLIGLLGNGFNMSAAEGFLSVSFVTYGMSIVLFTLMGGQTLRMVMATTARLFWKVKVVGKRSVLTEEPSLLLCERTSWLDTVIAMAILPRRMRYIVPYTASINHTKRRLYKLARLIPIPLDLLSSTGKEVISEIEKETSQGHSICLMYPVKERSKTMEEWEHKISTLFPHFPLPIIPLYIERSATTFAELFKTTQKIRIEKKDKG